MFPPFRCNLLLEYRSPTGCLRLWGASMEAGRPSGGNVRRERARSVPVLSNGHAEKTVCAVSDHVCMASTTAKSQLLSPTQVSRALGVSSASVRRWVGDGRLEGVRLGEGPLARIRVEQDAVDRFVRPASERHE